MKMNQPQPPAHLDDEAISKWQELAPTLQRGQASPMHLRPTALLGVGGRQQSSKWPCWGLW